MSQQTKKLSRVDHSVPVYSPRTSYNIIRSNDENLLSDLTLNFDPFTINVLKNEFYIRNWEMNLIDFILVVKEHLLSWQIDISNREKKLVRCLVLLFHEIDLNGNGILEWDEFTNFIIEKATVLNNIKTKLDEIKNYTLSQIRSQAKFQATISKVIYIPDIDRVAFYEDGSDEVFLMNHETGALNSKSLKVIPKPLIVEISSVKKESDNTIKIEKKETEIDRKTMVLDIYYIKDKKYQVLLTSTNDGYVRGWRYTSNGFVLATQPDNDDEFIEHHFKNDVYCLEWDGVNEILYCGLKDDSVEIGKKRYIINMWNLKTDTESTFDKIQKNHDSNDHDRHHTDVITSMIAMPKLQFLATAGLDGRLILWDTIRSTKKRLYKEHKRGIVSMAFNEQLILLFSAGFDHDFCVWNPYIDQYIHKISGHSNPLIGVIVIDHTSQLVSMDSSGEVKVWDVKKFNCVQTFSVESSDDKHKFNPQYISCIPKPLKLTISGRMVLFYEYDKNYNPLSVDDYPALCCKFDPTNLAFLTPHGNKVKVWNCLTGDIKKIYSDLTPGEITIFTLDELAKRMILGDSNGVTAVFNVINGALIKTLPKHNAEVCKIVHINSRELIVTASMDNTIKLSDDSKINEAELIRTIILTDVFITSLVYDPLNKFIVSGTNHGLVAFWELDTGKLNGSFHEQKEEEITSLAPIDESSYMFVSNAVGSINLIALPPLLFKYTKIFTFVNTEPEKNQPCGIVQMHYSKRKQKIFFIDDKGYLKCVKVEKIFKEIQGSHDFKSQRARDSVIKSFIQQPQFQENDMEIQWSVKAHFDQMKSLEYIDCEDIIVTTSFDKKVKIWNSITGEHIDSFQQNYDKKDPRPIAYRRIGTSELYNTNFDDRVDKEFWSQKKLMQMIQGKNRKQSQVLAEELTKKLQENNQKPEKGDKDEKGEKARDEKAGQKIASQIQSISQHDEEKHENLGDFDNFQSNLKQQNIYHKTEQEEFDPLFDYNKIEFTKLQSERSNDWKLKINYINYYNQFKNELDKVYEELKLKEEKLLEKAKKEGNLRRFNVNFQQTEMQGYGTDQQQGYEENQQKEKDEKDKNMEQMQKILDNTNKKVKSIFKGADGNNEEKYQKVQSKITNNNLYRQETKGKLMDKHTPDIKLSKEECEAAYKLAAALSNYDNEDYRILKFLDIKEREPERKKNQKVEKKNFIQANKQKITETMNLINELRVKQNKGNQKKNQDNL